jgi:hypothetical protein
MKLAVHPYVISDLLCFHSQDYDVANCLIQWHKHLGRCVIDFALLIFFGWIEW